MIVPQYIYGSNEELQRYFALLVQALQINLGGAGFVLPPQTTTSVGLITMATSFPVLQAGTMWFNSSTGKMQFIQVAADPATATNAVVEDITSTP